MVNLATQSVALAWGAWRHVRQTDTLLVVTNPPALPFLIVLLCRLKSVPCVLLIHDVYPDAALAAGVLKPGGWLARLADWLNTLLYRSANVIVVLGRDMQERIQARLGEHRGRVVVICNWAELDSIHPLPRDETSLLQEQKLEGKFIVEYAGNMARVNDIESLVSCAELLRRRQDIHFLFLGAGAKREWLEQQVAERALSNVTVLQSRPRSDQADFLNACDVGVVALSNGMYGVSVPSRTYNILAAGRPLLAIVEPRSEIARMIEEDGTGWVVPPSNPDALAELVQGLADDRKAVQAAARRARIAAERRYSLQHVLASYRQVICKLESSQL
jgi:glycosyltransferase involved in cell wall biosynthesis